MPDPVELRVSSAPFWHNGSRVSARNGHIMLAALIPVIAGVIRYGMSAVGVVLLSISSAVLWEVAVNIIFRRRISIFDGKSALTGLLLSMLLPATVPCWVIIGGTFLAIAVMHMSWGKTGIHPFNPVAVAIAVLIFLQTAFPVIDSALIHCRFGLNPVFHSDISLMALLMGHPSDPLGATFGVGLIIAGIYLMARGYIRWEISLSFLAGMIVTALCFHLYRPGPAGPVFHILSGYALIAAFFLATEDVTSPVHFIPMLIYGALGGILTVLIRDIGPVADGAIYAVLIINLLHPLFDRLRPGAIDGNGPKRSLTQGT